MKRLLLVLMLFAWVPTGLAEEEKLSGQWSTPATPSSPGATVQY